MQRFFRHLSLVLAFTAAVTACDDAADREAKYLERGKELFENGENIKARLEFRNVLQINPKSVEAQYFMGRIAEENANFSAAFQWYKRALEQDSNFIPSHSQLGKLYVMANDLATAGEHADVILAQEPASVDGKLIKSGIHLRRGDIDKAIAESRAVLAMDSENAAAAIILAGALDKKGHGAEALAVVENAIEKNPENKNLVRLKLQQHLDANEIEEAEATYQVLIQQSPEDLASRTELAWFYITHDRLDDAEASLRAAIAELPDDERAKRMLVDFLLNHRGLQAAEQELHGLIERHPGRNSYKFGLATLYAENDRDSEAAELYRQIIETDGSGPDGLVARSAFAHQLFLAGNKAAASQLVKEILDVDRENGTALLLRGRIRYSGEEYKDAIADLRSVLREDPNSESALGLLAEAHLREGQTELAMDALRNLIHLNPDNVRAIVRLATINSQIGNITRARSLIEDAISMAPNDPLVLKAQASVLLSQRDFDAATDTARKLVRAEGSEIEGRLLLGQILRVRGRYDDAFEEFRRLLETDKSSVIALNGAINSLISAGRFEEAERILQARIDLNSDDADTYNLLGQVYNTAGRDIEMVEPLFRRAAELSPNSATPLLNHGRALIGRHLYAEALDVIQAGLLRAPLHESLSLDLAYVYEKVGDINNAIATYEVMVGRNQGGDIAANNLAVLIADFEYEDSSMVEKAYQLASRFRDSEHPILLDTLGWVQYRLGNYSEAEKLVRASVEKGLDIPQVQYHLGMIYLALGKKKEAQETLSKAVDTGEKYHGLDVAKQTLDSM